MPSFNKVILMGNLTRDPDVRAVGSGAVKVCRFGLAVSERRKDRQGNPVELVTFVDIDTWERLAELCGQYLRKGHAVLVEGRLQMDTWEKDGQRHQKLKVRADAVKFLTPPNAAQSGASAPAAPAAAPAAPAQPPVEDLPF